MSSRDQISFEDQIRVLLIEPALTINNTLKGVLQVDMSLQIDTATSLEDAVNLLDTQIYECIVLSDTILGDNGLQFAAEIKKKVGYPLILTTQKSHSEISDQAHLNGVDEILNSIHKPGKLAILASRVKKNVEKWRADFLNVQLLNKNIDAIVILKSTSIVFANKQASDVMGLDDPSKLIGINVLDILVGEDPVEIQQLLDDTCRGNIPYVRRDSQIRKLDNEIIDFEIYLTGIIFKGEKACIAFCRDITERKLTERSFQENKQLLETFMDSAPESFYLYDSGFKLIKVNKSVFDRTAITEDDYGKHIFELSPILEKSERMVIYQRVMDTGMPETVEAVLVNDVIGKRVFSIRVFKVGSGLGLIMTDISDQRSIQNALEQSEENYRTLVENSPNAISVLLGTEIVYVNQRRVELTGHKDKSELIGVSSIQQIASDEVVKLLDRMEDRKAGKMLTPFTEFRMKRKDGEFINVLDYTTKIIWEGKDAVMHILQDVTESRRIEAELKRREEQYRRLFEDSNDAVFLYTTTGRIIDVNMLACKTLGFSKTQLLTMTTKELIFSDDMNQKNMEINLVLKDGSARFTRKFLKSDGSVIDVEISSSIVDPENKIIQGIVRDITEIVKYRDRLKVLHNHATLLSSAKTIREIAETTGKAVEETLGYHRGGFGIVEGNYLRFIYLLNIKIDGDDFKLPINGPGITVRTVREKRSLLVPDTRNDKDFYLPENPQYEPLSSLAVPVIIGGKVVAVINIESDNVDDFTEQDKELVETLALHIGSAISRLRKMEELEELVQEKTKDLLDAEQMVTAGKIAASVGHDLKSPLQIIKNAVYLMKQSPEDSEEMIKMIENSVDRANQMIEEFRNRTRDTPLNLSNVDLSDLIERTVKGLKIGDNVTVKLDIKSVKDVIIDSNKIQRVLENMIQNAIEAMFDGGTLSLETGIDGSTFYIKIMDTGVGIPMEKIATLFKPFQTTKTTGLGLGLTYCKRAVEAHGGRIKVESVVGEGTTFTLVIPNNLSEPEITPPISLY